MFCFALLWLLFASPRFCPCLRLPFWFLIYNPIKTLAMNSKLRFTHTHVMAIAFLYFDPGKYEGSGCDYPEQYKECNPYYLN